MTRALVLFVVIAAVLGSGPARAQDVRQLALGDNHTCALMGDTTVRCWGGSFYDQLGDGARRSRSVAAPVPCLDDVVELTAGAKHTCARGRDGRVRCWGDNGRAFALGRPQRIGARPGGAPDWLPWPVDALTDARGVAAGEGHVCTVLQDGHVACWGGSEAGQLGAGRAERHVQPLPLPFPSHVSRVTVGRSASCAQTLDATYCWGAANELPLLTAEMSTPQAVPALARARSLALGPRHGCAVLSEGAVHCWGSNAFGQLGVTGLSHRASSERLTSLSAAALAVTVGDGFSCALTTEGQVQCWGRGHEGQLGNGARRHSASPVPVAGLDAIAELEAGVTHVCARAASGAVHCWGANESGQVGDGTRELRATASRVQGLDAAAPADAARECRPAHIPPRDPDLRGEIFDPAPPPIADGPAVASMAFLRHRCARLANGDVHCWGLNDHGQLGLGQAKLGVGTPPLSPTLTGTTGVAVGEHFSCAASRDGTVQCWGANDAGQLGDGTTTERAVPGPASGLTDVRDVAAGLRHACALHRDGTVSCWGSDARTRFGEEPTPRPRATVVAGIAGAVHLAAGGTHTCVIVADGTLRCWGGTLAGPTLVPGVEGAVEVALDFTQFCARTRAGRVSCWSDSLFPSSARRDLSDEERQELEMAADYEEEATGNTNEARLINGVRGATSLAVGGSAACVVVGGRVRCWGSTSHGIVPRPADDDRPMGEHRTQVPSQIRGLTRVQSVSLGEGACAILAGGSVRCWRRGQEEPTALSW